MTPTNLLACPTNSITIAASLTPHPRGLLTKFPTAARLIPALAALATLLAPSLAHAQSTFKPIYDATDMLNTIPHHTYSTYKTFDGREHNLEAVLVGGVIYNAIDGKWTKSSITPQEARDEQREENRRIAKKAQCTQETDDSVSAEPTEVYFVRYKGGVVNIDTRTLDVRVWISKRTGLILRQEEDFESFPNHHKSRISARYDYSNITAPTISQ